VIYNLLGQRVKSLVQGQQSAGKYSIHWDGTSDAGRPVASGIYIYRITVDNYVQSRKMMLLK
jgi:flagellar hook assembly protein FlgD